MAKLGPGHGQNLLRSYNATLILCLLSEGPAYGAQLAKVIRERSRGYFKLKEGTLYPALHRMENDELIAGWWGPSTNPQKRRHYEITETGREALAATMLEWGSFLQAMDLVAPGRFANQPASM